MRLMLREMRREKVSDASTSSGSGFIYPVICCMICAMKPSMARRKFYRGGRVVSRAPSARPGRSRT